MEALPSLLGENDVVKYVTTLSGVASTSILDPNFYVRGGAGDENQLLVDGFPVASPQHISGVLSLFDPYMLPSSTLYKSGYPAEYGGVASSYLDMRTSHRRDTTIRGEASLGLIASSLRTAIPTSDDGGVALSLRGSYLTPIMRLAQSLGSQLDVVEYQFYDATASFSERLGSRWRTNIFALYSTDAIDVDLIGGLNFRWSSYSLNGSVERHDDNSTLSIAAGVWGRSREGRYSYLLDEPITYGEYTLRLQLRYSRHLRDRLTLRAALSTESALYRGGTEVQSLRDYLTQASLTLRWLSRGGVAAEGGVNLNSYVGATDELVALPRLRITAPIGGWSVAADYARTAQYTTTITTLSLPSPADIVMPLGDGEGATLVDQLSIGAEGRVGSSLSVSGAVFWRNYINAKEMAGVSLASTLLDLSDSDLMQGGEGGATGVEFEAALSRPRYSARLNYTLSDSWRQFDRLNGGSRYNPPFDITHNLTLTAQWQICQRLKISALWQYSSGRYLTFPVGVAVAYNVMEQSPTVVPVYDDIYNYRLPATHRLDIGVEYSLARWRLSAGIYNLYNQPNISFLSFSVEQYNDYQAYIQPVGTSLIPSIPYLSATFIW